MKPPNKKELTYIHMVFASDHKGTDILQEVKNLSCCVAEKARIWQMRTHDFERRLIEPGVPVKYKLLRVLSGDERFFIVDKVQYDEIYILIGEQYTYCAFYQEGGEFREGYGTLSCPCCPCCIRQQYERIVNSVKKFKYEKEIKSYILKD